MPELSPEVWLVLILLSLGYYAVDAVKAPVKHAGTAICRAVTLGHKCKGETYVVPPTTVLPSPDATEP